MANEYEIVNMAMEIVNQIGYTLYHEDYYSDIYCGKQYKYENLKISYYDNTEKGFKNLYIYLDGTLLLHYDFNNRKIDFINGRWMDLIKTIHSDIPTILDEKRRKQSDIGNRIKEMTLLEESFKYYIDANDNAYMSNMINSNLARYGIQVNKNKSYSQIRNLSTGDYEDSAVPTYTYQVYYNLESVAEFNGNKFNIFPNISMYANKFKPGEWTDIFKRVIDQTKNDERTITQEKTDTKADELIKRFRRSYN